MTSGSPDWCMRIAASDCRFADRLHTSVLWTHVLSLCWWHPPRKGWKLLDQGLNLAAHHIGLEWFPKSDHYSVRRSICQLGKTWTIPGPDHLIHTRIVVCQTGFDDLRCRTPHSGRVVRVMWSFSHPPPHKCQTPPTRSSGTFGMQTAQTVSSYLPTGSRLTVCWRNAPIISINTTDWRLYGNCIQVWFLQDRRDDSILLGGWKNPIPERSIAVGHDERN